MLAYRSIWNHHVTAESMLFLDVSKLREGRHEQMYYRFSNKCSYTTNSNQHANESDQSSAHVYLRCVYCCLVSTCQQHKLTVVMQKIVNAYNVGRPGNQHSFLWKNKTLCDWTVLLCTSTVGITHDNFQESIPQSGPLSLNSTSDRDGCDTDQFFEVHAIVLGCHSMHFRACMSGDVGSLSVSQNLGRSKLMTETIKPGYINAAASVLGLFYTFEVKHATGGNCDANYLLKMLEVRFCQQSHTHVLQLVWSCDHQLWRQFEFMSSDTANTLLNWNLKMVHSHMLSTNDTNSNCTPQHTQKIHMAKEPQESMRAIQHIIQVSQVRETELILKFLKVWNRLKPLQTDFISSTNHEHVIGGNCSWTRFQINDESLSTVHKQGPKSIYKCLVLNIITTHLFVI